MKEHAESEGHIHACQVETSTATALLRGSIARQLQQVRENEGSNQIPSTSDTLPIKNLPILLILMSLLIW